MNVPRWSRLLVIVAALGLAGCDTSPGGPLVVGVLLPTTGPQSFGYRRALELAQANIAAGGGVWGRAIDLRFVDIATADLPAAVDAMVKDDTVLAVIGPDSSTAAFAAATAFDAANKPLVLPSASSADLGRAFAGKRTMWRTIESDIAQTRVLLELAARNGAHKVALLTTFAPYGQTFFDWFAFYATELGLEVTASNRRPLSAASCADDVREVAATAPEALLIVPSDFDELSCTAFAYAGLAVRPRLYYPDIGRNPALVAALGAAADGIEGTAPAARPDSGFREAWLARYAEEPPTYAANTYDALLLLAYGLTASDGHGGQALLDGLVEVTSPRGENVGADAAGVARTLELLRGDKGPDIRGASSRLRYDSLGYTDLTSSTYGLWRVEAASIVTTEYVDTGTDEGDGSERAAFASIASAGNRQVITDNPDLAVGPRTGLWALIVAASEGWPNYRHQADALAQYQLLRANGVPDDHIVLVVADDLAANPDNRAMGIVRNIAGGPNVREPAQIDYLIGDLAPSDLGDILLGNARSGLPSVLQSGPGDDVYVFLVGHGGSSGLALHAGAADFIPSPETLFTPAALGLAVRTLAQRTGYRRMLIAVEMCHGGVMGAALDSRTPRAALISGAAPFENSFASNYDGSLQQWLGDAFAFALWDAAAMAPSVDLRTSFGVLYQRVAGSHVSLYNTPNFGVTGDVPLGDFFRP